MYACATRVIQAYVCLCDSGYTGIRMATGSTGNKYSSIMLAVLAVRNLEMAIGLSKKKLEKIQNRDKSGFFGGADYF